MLRRPAFLIVAAILVGAAAALAQQDMSKIEVVTTSLSAHVSMLKGAGGNIGVFAGPDGVVMIDDQYPQLTEKIRAAIGKISDKPVRFVLNTHWHGDHTGGNESFAAAGATLIAQDRVRARMSADYSNPVFGWSSKPSPAAALPVLTFSDSMSFHLNGVDVVCFHVPNAHTDGDVVVWFPGENVLHAGDVFFNGNFPILDVGTGGTVNGMIAAQERILGLIGPDTKVIPGHGPLGTKADLQAAHDMLVQVRDRVKGLVAKKMTLEQIQAARPLADLEEKWGKGYVKADLMLKAAVLDMERK
jgi:glyoxylase-like metal-dependent hydrolase (beta-lactamase superfamily II)